MRQPDAFTQIIEFTPAMRVLIADAIEALILLLDEIDGDADFEIDEESEDEREWDDAEKGIADIDGLAEQCPNFMNAAE